MQSAYDEALQEAFNSLDAVTNEALKVKFNLMIAIIYSAIKDAKKSIEYYDFVLGQSQDSSLIVRTHLLLSDLHLGLNDSIRAGESLGAAMRLKLDSQVLFETGKFELKPEGIDALKELAESISVLKKGNVIVEGHTNDVGDASFNKKLSLARSKSVVAELKKLIPGSSFKWLEKGMGESKPIVENDSDESRAKNRRVEILVVPN